LVFFTTGSLPFFDFCSVTPVHEKNTYRAYQKAALHAMSLPDNESKTDDSSHTQSLSQTEATVSALKQLSPILEEIMPETKQSVGSESPENTTTRASSKRTSDKILVGVTDTPESEWGFYYAINHMDIHTDILYILSVGWVHIGEEEISKKILAKFGKEAENCGVKHYHLLLGLHQDVAAGICATAKLIDATSLVIGHSHDSSWMSRVFSPSISKYCYAHCPCPITKVSAPTKLALDTSPPVATLSRSLKMEHSLNTSASKEERCNYGDVMIVAGLKEMVYKEVIVEDKSYLIEILLSVLGTIKK